MKYIQFAFFMVWMASCQTKNDTDYVKLIIPDELMSNEEVVQRLQEDADELNNVFISLEEYYKDIVELENGLSLLDESATTDELKESLQKWQNEIEESQNKFAANILWFVVKEMKEEDSLEIIDNLSEKETIHYRKCQEHLQLQKEVCRQKVEKISQSFEELMKTMEEKSTKIESTALDNAQSRS